MSVLTQWLQQLHFIRPWWLLCLVLIPIAFFLRKRSRRDSSEWASVVSAELLQVLMPKEVMSKQYRVADIVISVAFAIAFLALAGPSWEKLPQPVDRKSDNLILVWDLSHSMYVADISPSRFVRAKQKIIDILRNRTDGTTGLIAYAGDAHIVTPLTQDTDTILHLVSSLDPQMMPIPGSNTSDAVGLASQLIQKSASQNGRILIIADDIEQSAELAQIDLGAAQVHVLGVGTPQGGPIPVNDQHEFLRDNQGNMIRPKLDSAKLRKYAQANGGTYSELTLDDSDIRSFFDEAWIGDADTTRVENREFDVWHDAGYLLLLPLAILAVLGLRRGVVVVALLVVAPSIKADWRDDIWVPRDRQGYDALEDGRSQEAEELFEDSDWLAVAKYRSGKFEEAAEMFQGNETLESEYNLGNALAKNGQIEDAIATYARVLDRDPTHEDAKYNKEILEELLDQLQEQSQQQQGESQQQQSEEESGQSSDQSQQQSEQQGSESNESSTVSPESETQETQEDEQLTDHGMEEQSDQSNDDPSDSEATTQTNEERESEDALDRWLRRIPDDPGSLLSNKFRQESIQRIRKGEIELDRTGPNW